MTHQALVFFHYMDKRLPLKFVAPCPNGEYYTVSLKGFSDAHGLLRADTPRAFSSILAGLCRQDKRAPKRPLQKQAHQ